MSISPVSTFIHAVPFTSDALIQLLLDRNVNDYVSIGLSGDLTDDNGFKGRITYKSDTTVHILYCCYYIVVDIKNRVVIYQDNHPQRGSMFDSSPRAIDAASFETGLFGIPKTDYQIHTRQSKAMGDSALKIVWPSSPEDSGER